MAFASNISTLGLYNMDTIEAMYASSLHMNVIFIKNKFNICFGIDVPRTVDVGYYIKAIQQDINDVEYYINKCLSFTTYNRQAYINIKSFADFMFNQVKSLHLESVLNS